MRGALVGSADRAELEGSTAAFTKRVFRDRWNRIIVRRIANTRAHTLKIKARVRARGARGQEWFSQGRVAFAQKRSRTQMQWVLQLSGDFHPSEETAVVPHQEPHMMRVLVILSRFATEFIFSPAVARNDCQVMLVSNLAVEQRFANGNSIVPRAERESREG